MVKEEFHVFIDVCIFERPFERMAFELFHDKAPFSAENFRVLCTGEKGLSPITDKHLWYKDRYIHVKKGGSYVKGGVFSCETGEGGESALGQRLLVESNNLKHDRPGLLSMPRDGSHFLITLEADQSLDSSHVVFGKLVKGWRTLWRMRDYSFYCGAKIIYSGELYDDELPSDVAWSPSSDDVDEGSPSSNQRFGDRTHNS